MKSANLEKYVTTTRPLGLRDFGWFTTQDIADIICEAYPDLSNSSQRRLSQIAALDLRIYDFDSDNDSTYKNDDFEPTSVRCLVGKNAGRSSPAYSRHATKAILEMMKFEVNLL